MSFAATLKKVFLTEKEPASCLGCGDCCRAFGGHLNATKADLDRWRELGRDDLLAGVNRLGWIWVDTETKQRLPRCPHLVETAPSKAHCAIHAIKPDMCRAYPTLAHYKRCLRGVFLGVLACFEFELDAFLLISLGLDLQMLV